MDRATLVAVVVTHNRLGHLKNTLAHLLRAKDALTAIVVVDNASNDGTTEWLSGQTHNRVHIINNTKNLGGAGGFEKGMRHAYENFNPDWIVVMDDDAHPTAGTLNRFVARDRSIAEAWAAAVYYPDGEICDMNRPWINPLTSVKGFVTTLVRGRDGFHLTKNDYEASSYTPIDGGSFVGLFFSRRSIERVGFPDPRLFLYGDDVLYTLSLSHTGGKILFDPELAFEHDCTTLSQQKNSKISPLWKVYYFHRNQTLVYACAAGPVLFWPIILFKAAGWFRRANLYSDEERSLYRKVLRLALQDGLSRRMDRSLSDIMKFSITGTF